MKPGRWIPVPVIMAVCFPMVAQTRVEIVCDEAEAVLAILALRGEGKTPTDADWKRLFESEGYRRLVVREASFKHVVEEAAFKDFVLGQELLTKAPDLARTLKAWRSADMTGCGQRALAYLPAGAAITARVYPVIKPWTNSFVFEGNAIFLYLDPARTNAQFENTVTHELHHIGLESVQPDPATKAAWDKLPPARFLAIRWVSAFGEGYAMLAAAGGPEIHPHASSPAEDRQRWDRDMARFDQDLRLVEAFLLDVAEGRLKGEAMEAKGMDFFGVQGPWYTVGWRMASSIEKVLGRPALLGCMRDPRKLLPTFNEAVARGRLPYATWSPRLLAAMGGD